ncbi:hypothetical protein [Vibrio phage RYC]|nr:hypothetical protein [Vibrio phage RYC]
MSIYSDTPMKPLVIEGEMDRVYKGARLTGRAILKEGMKLLKVLLPSIGTAIDQLTGNADNEYAMPTTMGAAFQLLHENLEEEHFDDLCDKLLGQLTCNGKEVTAEHWDKYPQDLVDVLAWAGKENFKDFLMESTIIKSKLEVLSKAMPQKLKEQITSVWNVNETDTDSKESKSSQE